MQPIRCIIATIFLVPAFAMAADHLNLEDGQPTRIRDAYAIKKGSIELQASTGYERMPDDDQGRHRYFFVPKIELGIAPNFQLSLEAPYRTGNASGTEQGDLDLEGLYNFNTEGRYLPALSLGAGISKPYGRDSGGTETSLSFLSTKSMGPFGSDYRPKKLHLNLDWHHNWDPRSDEREDRYFAGVGYSQPIHNEWVAVASVYREQQREKGVGHNMVEFGLRHQWSPLTVLTIGTAAGLNSQAPDWALMFGFQHTLGKAFPQKVPRSALLGERALAGPDADIP